MKKIDFLKDKVCQLYEAKNPDRADWADWLFQNHVFVVVNYAEAIAKKIQAKEELAMAAGMLHDIADAEMSRFDERHTKRSQEIAETLLKDAGFPDREIATVIDAINHHGCRDGKVPVTSEGKVMATADAVAHLSTKFYDYARKAMGRAGKSSEEIASWALSKIERDYNDKIFFDEVRTEVLKDYERVKALFCK
ncbi:MAG: HD domain-containing protein [Candidatus Moranbacteria bacterium]|nr:HD domain-containing protein [Candidatus Moranbacteria bacterium]